MGRHGTWWVRTERLKVAECRQVAAPNQWSIRWFQKSWQILRRTNWTTMVISDVLYFSWPTLVEKQGCLTTQESPQGWRKGSTRFAGPQNGDNRTALKQKNSESPDRKLQGSSLYRRIAIYFALVTFIKYSLIVAHSSVHMKHVCWWMCPVHLYLWQDLVNAAKSMGATDEQLSSALQLLKRWKRLDAEVHRVLGCDVVEGDDISR